MEAIRTRQHLDNLIADRIEENASLEYKGAGSLGRSDVKKREITKDVSAFANSAGGTIVYGIRETPSANPPRLPDAIDPIDCREISKEWLDQIIGQIRPKIVGLKISSIQVGPTDTDYVYVVDIPQGSTAHQSLDHRYYARRCFESTSMEDYEVRDVMHRAIHPSVDADLRMIADFPFDKRSHIALRIKNIGNLMARHYAAVIRMPIRNGNGLILPEKASLRTDDGPAYWTFSFSNMGKTPLFPASEVVHSKDFKHMQRMDPDPGETIEEVEIAIYADNMPKVTLRKSFQDSHDRWI